jgi:hypothetical protein
MQNFARLYLMFLNAEFMKDLLVLTETGVETLFEDTPIAEKRLFYESSLV